MSKIKIKAEFLNKTIGHNGQSGRLKDWKSLDALYKHAVDTNNTYLLSLFEPVDNPRKTSEEIGKVLDQSFADELKSDISKVKSKRKKHQPVINISTEAKHETSETTKQDLQEKPGTAEQTEVGNTD